MHVSVCSRREATSGRLGLGVDMGLSTRVLICVSYNFLLVIFMWQFSFIPTFNAPRPVLLLVHYVAVPAPCGDSLSRYFYFGYGGPPRVTGIIDDCITFSVEHTSRRICRLLFY